MKQDASFYAILPVPAAWGQDYELDIAYAGDDVITSEGGGNFAVGARTSWYPSLGSFKDRATFDLTFRYPKQFTLVSVGGLVEEKKEKDFSVARWKSDVPLTVAGFNYGRFTKKHLVDEPTGYQIDGYATNQAPDFLRQFEVQDSVNGVFDGRTAIGRLSPKRMMDSAMADTQVSIRLFTQYFGPLPFGRIAVTQQPQFSFGQSWPSLVYLPVSAFLDSTQRWANLGSDAFEFADFIQEVTPHEVAHQWWGHVVGWDSYHDQWISEGFADFSAGLFLQAVRGKDQYLRFVEHWKEAILSKNRFGYAPNDVGPIWMGQRIHTAKTGDAYRKLIYPKGGYVLHMLRWIMYSPQKGDEAFIAMMHDFVKSHHNRNASTESFQAVVERHMTNLMDLKGNRKMDWFFDQWVRGTEIPSYELRCKLTPLEGGKSNLKFTVTQSGVSDDFLMAVPVYAEVQGKTFKLGMVGVKGNSTTSDFGGDMGFTPDRLFLNAHHDILANEIKVTPM